MSGGGRRSAHGPRVRATGFTLLELVIVLTLAGLVLAIGAISFGEYFRRAAAQRAAQVFAQDLAMARNLAMRSQEPVVIRFFESALWYQVELQQSANEVTRRRFGANADIDLSAVTLDMRGDSLVFDARGIVNMVGAVGVLGAATFSSGSATYTVSFNSMGASKIDQT